MRALRLPPAALVVILGVLTCMHLPAGGQRERPAQAADAEAEAQAEPEANVTTPSEPAAGENLTPEPPATPSEEPQSQQPAVDESAETSALGIQSTQAEPQETEVQRHEVQQEAAALAARVAQLERENAQLRELLDEAQFMLTLFAAELPPAEQRPAAEALEPPRVQQPPVQQPRADQASSEPSQTESSQTEPNQDAPASTTVARPGAPPAGVGGMFALPEGTTQRYLNDERFVVIESSGDRRIVDANANRSTGTGIFLEIADASRQPRLELVLQLVATAASDGGRQVFIIPPDTEPVAVYGSYEAVTGGGGDQVRIVHPIDPDDRELLAAVLTPGSSVSLGGVVPVAAFAIGEDGREALRRVLYLFRDLGGAL